MHYVLRVNRDSKLTMGQASVRALAIRAGIDLDRNYKDQSITKLAKLVIAVSAMAKVASLTNFKKAREAEPYLAKFEDDWATGQILRQYINGRHKYENAKSNGKLKVGGKRGWAGSSGPVASKRFKQMPSASEDEGGFDKRRSGAEEYDDDEDDDEDDGWNGITMAFGGSDGADVDG
jgi:hypothetical protein